MKALWQRHRILVVGVAIILLPICYGSLVALDIAPLPDIAAGRHVSGYDSAYAEPVQLANLENVAINESSGIAASRANDNIMWTHNDSGDGPFIYAIDRQGKHRGAWRVIGAEARDWEDIAVGPGPDRSRSYIYIGDIGDNGRSRDNIVVYRIREPAVSTGDPLPSVKARSQTDPADVIRLKYPDGKHDAEALLINPSTGTLYVVTKAMRAAARIYKLDAAASGGGVQALSLVGEVQIPNLMGGLITGGDISPDGRRVVLCSYLGASELVLSDRNAPFDDVWKQQPTPVNIGTRKQGEAVCYRVDGLALLATSEGVPCPLIEASRRPSSQ